MLPATPAKIGEREWNSKRDEKNKSATRDYFSRKLYESYEIVRCRNAGSVDLYLRAFLLNNHRYLRFLIQSE